MLHPTCCEETVGADSGCPNEPCCIISICANGNGRNGLSTTPDVSGERDG
uniref:Uncharacterized protein n=1 Tax=Nothobranchius korthausae TaxID=1143690 RepID=A0A1A8H8J2_9TELE